MFRTLLFRMILVLAASMVALGCSRRSPTEVWPPNTDPVVFREIEDFGLRGLRYEAFAGSKYDALSIDSTESFNGGVSLKFTVPDPGDPTGGYAGGAFISRFLRSLAGYNALSFYIKASRAVTINEVGLGNDNTGTSRYTAVRTAVPVTTSWTRVLVPIPLPEKLSGEGGLFFVSSDHKSGSGYTFWVDDIEFVSDPSVTNPRPGLSSQILNVVSGTSVNLSGSTRTAFDISGTGTIVNHSPGYFTFTSTAPAIADVRNGRIDVLSSGSAVVTARLGTVAATGSVTLNATAPPLAAAPTPTHPAGGVISLFSNSYSSVNVDHWRAFGSTSAQVQDVRISGNDTKVYTGLASGFVGIEFKTNAVDASTANVFHMDVWVAAGTTFKVKLVDFGPDGIFSPAVDDTQSELTFNASSTPALATGTWISIDLPLANFTGLANPARRLSQLVLSGDTPTVFVDNIYFHP